MTKRAGLVIALALTAITILTGCGGGGNDLNAFLLKPRAPVSGVEYRVLPPDTITVRSVYVPEINGVTQRVRPDGVINIPLLGEIYVAGQTPHEIEQTLMQAASKYYEKVDATVNVTGYSSQMIYVFGQVSSPGPQAWTGTNTLLDVLARSRPTTLAWPERIRVVRGRAPKRGGYLPGETPEETAATAEGKDVRAGYKAWAQAQESGPSEPRILVVNMNKMIQKGDMSHNVLLQPDDVVYVEANPLAKVGLAIQQLLFPVRPTLETARLPAQAMSAGAIP